MRPAQISGGNGAAPQSVLRIRRVSASGGRESGRAGRTIRAGPSGRPVPAGPSGPRNCRRRWRSACRSGARTCRRRAPEDPGVRPGRDHLPPALANGVGPEAGAVCTRQHPPRL